MKLKAYIITVLILSGIIACGQNIPVKELSLARKGIKDAEKVKAPKYAKEEYNESIKLLKESHTNLSNEKINNAKQDAIKSIEASNKAIEKSLPLYSADMLKEAENSIKNIETLNAKEFAPAEYAMAASYFSDAKKQNDEKKYRESIKNSQLSIDQANKAKAIALAKIPELKEQISILKNEIELTKSNRGEEFAKEELISANESLNNAGQFIDEQLIVESVKSIHQAKDKIEKAKLLTAMGIAKESLESAKNLYNDVLSNELSKEFEEQTIHAKNTIDQSEKLLNENIYEKSYEKSQEAIDLLNSIMITMEKKAEELKAMNEKKQKKQETEKSQSSPKIYIVQYNPKNHDCLWKIALKVYKNPRLWPLIYVTNRDQIKDPDLIFPGQRFIIPPIKKIRDNVNTDESKNKNDLKKIDNHDTDLNEENNGKEIDSKTVINNNDSKPKESNKTE